MRPAPSTRLRWGTHVVAGLLIVAGIALTAVTGGVLWARLIGEAMALLGLVWFVQPWLERLRRFVQRGRR